LTSIIVELSGFGSVSTTSVAGSVVGDRFVAVADGVMVGTGFVVAKTVGMRVDGTAVGENKGVGADAQAAIKITARMSTMI